MDLEWNPRSKPAKPALLQLATENGVALLRLNRFAQFPTSLHDFLLDDKVKKVGLGVLQDIKKLEDQYNISIAGGKDIADIPVYIRCRPLSLKGLVALFLQQCLPKSNRITMSNWEQVKLTNEQIEYAGTKK